MSEAVLERRALVSEILSDRKDAAVITGLGSPTYDVASAGDNALNFYLWGAMGGAAALGLGLALAQPSRRILVVTGDAEALMGVGSFATIAAQAPGNLALLVLDNEAFCETGAQSGLTGKGADIAAMAAGAGIAVTMTARTHGDVPSLKEMLWQARGPALAVAKIKLTRDPVVLPPREGVLLQHRFREATGQEKLGAESFAV